MYDEAIKDPDYCVAGTHTQACTHTLECKPTHIVLTFKHMPGHASVHMSTAQKALYLCWSTQEREEQDSGICETKKDM